MSRVCQCSSSCSRSCRPNPFSISYLISHTNCSRRKTWSFEHLLSLRLNAHIHWIFPLFSLSFTARQRKSLNCQLTEDGYIVISVFLALKLEKVPSTSIDTPSIINSMIKCTWCTCSSIHWSRQKKGCLISCNSCLKRERQFNPVELCYI